MSRGDDALGAGLLASKAFNAWRHDGEGLLAGCAAWNVAFVFGGVWLGSWALTAVGGVAVAAWLVHLAHRVFADAMLFPIVLVSIGIAILVAGTWMHRHRSALAARMDSRASTFGKPKRR